MMSGVVFKVFKGLEGGFEKDHEMEDKEEENIVMMLAVDSFPRGAHPGPLHVWKVCRRQEGS
jgi:hypothetical protein